MSSLDWPLAEADMSRDRNTVRSESLADLSGLVYGLYLRGKLPQEFRAYLYPVAERESVREREVRVRYQVVGELPRVDEIWASERRPMHGNSRLALFRQLDGFGLSVECEGSGLFRFTSGGIEIEWSPWGAGAAHYFFAYALPLWLESKGRQVLHASAVSFGGRGVALLGPSGIGKSTLCAGLVTTGYDFVADDGLVLREDGDGDWRCLHGPPFLRLWPSALEDRLGVEARDLPRVHESLEKRLMECAREDVCTHPGGLKLAAVYSLVRQTESQAQVSISPCTARDSLIHLIEHSLAGAPVAALGWSARRLEQFSRLAMQTPVKYLRYPDGNRWHLVGEAILKDLAG